MPDTPPPCCEQCGCPTHTRIVLFRQNISYLVARQEKHFCGRLCPACMTKTYLKFTATTLLLTWFGVIGAALGPCFVIMNSVEYLMALTTLLYHAARRPA